MMDSRSRTVAMDYARICGWLGMPNGEWPPDHYALLGVEKGEQDLTRLEAQVQERLRLVRSYQLSNPELATEAMNRLAEAFACLSDPAAKRHYDLQHGITVPPAAVRTPSGDKPRSAPKSKAADDTVTSGLPTVMVWTGAGPPPVRQPA